MFKFNKSNNNYWVGHNKELGYVIYDPLIQNEAREGFVLLFVVNRNTSTELKKDIIRKKLTKTDMLDVSLSENYLDSYLKSSTNKSPHKYVTTMKSQDDVFHKSTCGWMKHVPMESEIIFRSRDDAIRRGFTPCKSCKP
ncbi:hypothetical protein ACPV5U_28755 [Vibrio mediterranei]